MISIVGYFCVTLKFASWTLKNVWRTQASPADLRGCLPKILKPILDYITDFLETFCVIYTLVG